MFVVPPPEARTWFALKSLQLNFGYHAAFMASSAPGSSRPRTPARGLNR